MLTMTEQAASTIHDLISQADLPETAGLRIAQREDHTALAKTLAPEPGQDDLVLAERDVTGFLGPIAAHRVQAQTLDAVTADTSAAFYLRD